VDGRDAGGRRGRVSYQGTDGPRTVVTTMTTSAFEAPVLGSTVDVFHDPDDDESIMVRARSDPAARFPF
jgi:hypothetical protein